jgi:hypothetical protein
MFNKLFAPYLTLDAHIDAFQETKRGLTDKIITDPTLNKAAHNFIDAQSEFAKMLAHNFTDIAKYSMDAYTDRLLSKDKEVTEAKVTKAKSAQA